MKREQGFYLIPQDLAALAVIASEGRDTAETQSFDDTPLVSFELATIQMQLLAETMHATCLDFDRAEVGEFIKPKDAESIKGCVVSIINHFAKFADDLNLLDDVYLDIKAQGGEGYNGSAKADAAASSHFVDYWGTAQ